MEMTHAEPLTLLRNHFDLKHIPFSERGSRLMLFCDDSRFSIRLAERWAAWEHEFGHYRRRLPLICDFQLTDGFGQPLAFKLSCYPHVIEMETHIGTFSWVFSDEESLLLTLPQSACGVRFRVLAAQGHTDRRGGEFKGDPMHRRTHRNVAYTTNARIVQNTISPDRNGYQQVIMTSEPRGDLSRSTLLLNITPRLGFNRALGDPAEAVVAASRRWEEWFDAAPPALPTHQLQYYYAWWCMRAGLLSPRFFLTRESMVPSKTWYVGIWHWDAFFHALAYRHIDQQLAEDQLRVMVDHQREDGMIPDAVHDEGAVFEFKQPHTEQMIEVTKPPLLAWTALKLYQTSRNLDFLSEMYGPLKRWHNWWFEKNDDDCDGVVQYNHPYSSGLDDSPLWDGGMPVESPDINTYLVMQADALAQIAELLGEEEDAVLLRARADDLTQKIIAHFWDEEAGLFWATRHHERIPVVTLFNLYPLLTGRLPRAMSDRLVEHLLSPQEFWTEFPLATVSIRDPQFDPNQMWRGPTWVNVNYLFIEGLLKCGYEREARELRDRTLALLMRHLDLYEYYNPLTGNAPPKAASIFGWSSAVFIDLAVNAAAGRII